MTGEAKTISGFTLGLLRFAQEMLKHHSWNCERVNDWGENMTARDVVEDIASGIENAQNWSPQHAAITVPLVVAIAKKLRPDLEDEEIERLLGLNG